MNMIIFPHMKYTHLGKCVMIFDNEGSSRSQFYALIHRVLGGVG